MEQGFIKDYGGKCKRKNNQLLNPWKLAWSLSGKEKILQFWEAEKHFFSTPKDSVIITKNLYVIFAFYDGYLN